MAEPNTFDNPNFGSDDYSPPSGGSDTSHHDERRQQPEREVQRAFNRAANPSETVSSQFETLSSYPADFHILEQAQIDRLAAPNELPRSLPQDRPQPTRLNTFHHKLQMELRVLLQRMDSMQVLMRRIQDEEGVIAPNQPASNLLHDKMAVELGGTMLLNSVPRDRLKALLDNIYVPTAIARGWHAVDSQLAPTFNDRAERLDTPDPGIYMNCLSPRSGLGVSRKQFQSLIAAIRVLSGQLSHRERERLAIKLLDKDGKEINDRVQEMWKKLHSDRGQEVIDFTQEEYATQIEEQPHVLPFIKSESDDEATNTSASDDNEESDNAGDHMQSRLSRSFKPFAVDASLRRNMANWAKSWADLIDTSPQHILYFPLPTEVGYSINLYQRMQQHRQLRGSARLMQVVFVTAAALFPDLNFVMYQFVLFRLFEAAHASIAECLGTTMNMAYLKTGGFNTVQAGIQVTSANTNAEGTHRRWETVQHHPKQLEVAAIVRQNQIQERMSPDGLLEYLRARRQRVELLERMASTRATRQL